MKIARRVISIVLAVLALFLTVMLVLLSTITFYKLNEFKQINVLIAGLIAAVSIVVLPCLSFAIGFGRRNKAINIYFLIMFIGIIGYLGFITANNFASFIEVTRYQNVIALPIGLAFIICYCVFGSKRGHLSVYVIVLFLILLFVFVACLGTYIGLNINGQMLLMKN